MNQHTDRQATLEKGAGIDAQKFDANSGFNFPNLPPGNNPLVIWDNFLNIIRGVRS